MAKAPKLKVFRTPIGFHDAYVAAPSQKAALEAWGAEANLFARGVAEQVTDPKLMEEPLARPGEVIRKLRGNLEEHLGALPPDPKPSRQPSKSKPTTPPPSRSNLESAEQALAGAEEAHADRLAELKRREEALALERRTLVATQAKELKRLEQARDKEQRAYDTAARRWRQG
jgi:hypothetical protein